MSTFHESLKAEIQFWQDLIRASGPGLHADERKRMEHAILFAQLKLLKGEYEATNTSPKHRNTN